MSSSDYLPEGLDIRSGAVPGTLEIVDAQEHVLVTLHDGAPGDPIEWRQSILDCVVYGLNILADERWWLHPEC